MEENVNIADNLTEIRVTVPFPARLIAVSKTKPVEDIQVAYQAGQRLFGENKALEMRDKHEALPKDIEWHFIGHLQTNKVKYIAPFVSLVHSIDSLELLKVVDKEGQKHGRVIPCLLQFHIASEETKFGLDWQEAQVLLESDEYKHMKNISIAGVMGMATNTPDEAKVRSEFHHLKEIYVQMKDTYFRNSPECKEISMGMSHDYRIALEEGSTLVRVGQSIFGARNYAIPVNDK